MKILVAEDDPVARRVLTQILASDREHQTTVAEHGVAAWELLDDPARSFDVVFLDLGLPKIDGFELLRRIKESPLLKSLEVILCTASNDRATVVRAAQHGARHYIIKPCNAEVVRAKLRQLQPASESTGARKPA
jgi:two-component system chemotaxis response regulator CheY